MVNISGFVMMLEPITNPISGNGWLEFQVLQKIGQHLPLNPFFPGIPASFLGNENFLQEITAQFLRFNFNSQRVFTGRQQGLEPSARVVTTRRPRTMGLCHQEPLQKGFHLPVILGACMDAIQFLLGKW